MLKVPRMLDEIDPLPEPPEEAPKVSRKYMELLSDCLAEAAAWTSVPGKPHFYTRNGKLKYEPPVPESGDQKFALPTGWCMSRDGMVKLADEFINFFEWPPAFPIFVVNA